MVGRLMDKQDVRDMVRMIPAALLFLVGFWAFLGLLYAIVPGPGG